jgi:ABC-2 type transport system permease protein
MSFSGLTGFKTLARREILRFLRRPRNTFVPPFVTNVLYFSVFGVILGDRVGEISIGASTEPIPYILFILPGLVVLGAISNAFENASFSIFHGRWNDYFYAQIESVLFNGGRSPAA